MQCTIYNEVSHHIFNVIILISKIKYFYSNNLNIAQN